MKVVSVNVGEPREVLWKGLTVRTGIFKDPVSGSVMINPINLGGDAQADLTVHGGAAKAVYGYPSEHYAYWRQELLDQPLPWGMFGENLTTEGLSEDTVCIGDRLTIGGAVLEVTQPRVPCYKLALKFDRDDILKRFLRSGKSGFYFSVIQPGEVRSDESIEIMSRDSQHVSVSDINRLFLGQARDPDLLMRVQNLGALPQSWKSELLRRA